MDKQWTWAVGLMTLVITGIVSACGQEPATTADLPTPTPTVTPRVEETPFPEIDRPEDDRPRPRNQAVELDGRIVPVQSVALRFGIEGVVEEVLTEENQEVQRGDVLARLVQTDLRLQVQEAELAVEQARLSINQAQISASQSLESYEQRVQQAEASVRQAENRLRQVQVSVTEQDIIASQADLEAARVTLSRLQGGPPQSSIESARAALTQAETNLEAQRDSLSAAKNQAQLRMEQAANALRNRQDAYSTIHWANRNTSDLTQESRDQEAAALRDVEDAESSLEQARLAYELAQQMEVNGIAIAETEVRNAEIDLEELLSGPDQDELASARAAVARAENALQSLQGEQRLLQEEATAADVQQAQQQLANLDPGAVVANAEVGLTRAELNLRQAELNLDRAELELSRSVLRAPVEGTVAQISVKRGEIVNATDVAVVLADMSEWYVESTGLSEIEVTRVRPGDSVTIYIDALPDVELSGEVARISTVGNTTAGSVTYNAMIRADEWDERIRWNMTVSVVIQPEDNEDEDDD
jgi:HlyD family secretion protein